MLTLKPRERVIRAIRHETIDRVPKGELFFPPGLLGRLAGCRYTRFREPMLGALRRLKCDLVCLHFDPISRDFAACPPSTEEIKFWAEQTDYFVVAGIPGVFWPVARQVGFEAAARLALANPAQYREIAAERRSEGARLIEECLGFGAHGIAILDDLAGNDGTFFSPRLLRRTVLPELAELVGATKRHGVPVFFHSDGFLGSLLDDLVGMGVDVLHGCRALDPETFKERFGGRATVMGNFGIGIEGEGPDTGLLADWIRETIWTFGPNGGYIASTDGGLSEESSVEELKCLYTVAHKTRPGGHD